jgi:flagellar protein FliS
MLKATHAYLQTQIATTSQADVLIMLYDGALKFLLRPRSASRPRTWPARDPADQGAERHQRAAVQR